MDPLTLDQIDVYGLFTPDTNYTEIKLNDPERTTIIHGINGCGKTTLMKMLYGFFTGDYNIFKKTRFNSFHLHFSDGTTIRIYSHFHYLARLSLDDNSYDKYLYLYDEHLTNNCAIFLEYINNTNFKDYEIFVITPEGIDTLGPKYINSSNLEEIKSKIREYEDALSERSDYNTDSVNISTDVSSWFDEFGTSGLKAMRDKFQNQRELNPNPNEFDIYPHNFPYEPDLLKNIRDKIPVCFIQTQRLVHFDDRSSKGKSAIDECVEDYNSILDDITNITKKMAEHFALNFPDRLITKFNNLEKTDFPTIPELEKKIDLLNEELEHLCDCGIEPELRLDQRFENTIEGSDHENGPSEEYLLYSDRLGNPISRPIIDLALDDAISNVTLFGPLRFNMDYFNYLIEVFKTSNILLQHNMEPKVFNGRTRLESNTFRVLSSGEQNLLKIFFELLFKPLTVFYGKLGEGSFEHLHCKLNMLFLIDEPELSLHITWQKRFLEDMLLIQKNSVFASISILIATHSPDFINDRWDLTYSMNPSGRD